MSTPLSADSHPPSGWRADDLTPADVAPLLARFRSYYSPTSPDECWSWRGYKLASGYGVLKHSRARSNLLAHRIAWVAGTNQPLTGNLTIDHLCRNRACVNPTHLEPVTMSENASRARRAALGGRLQTKDEARHVAREAERRRYWADPEKARAKRAARKPCPECGGMYRSNGFAKHLRTHGGAA